jgi:hypothetical protein
MHTRRLLATSMIAMALILALLPGLAWSSIIVVTLPEFNGAGLADIGVPRTVGDFLYVLPAGEDIVFARYESTLGNTTVPNTAIMDVFVDGILVGQCVDMADPCWIGTLTVPFEHTFAPGEFAALADGVATLTVLQLECCTIRLGESTLTIHTASVPAPWAVVLLASGLAGLVSLRGARRFLKR